MKHQSKRCWLLLSWKTQEPCVEQLKRLAYDVIVDLTRALLPINMRLCVKKFVLSSSSLPHNRRLHCCSWLFLMSMYSHSILYEYHVTSNQTVLCGGVESWNARIDACAWCTCNSQYRLLECSIRGDMSATPLGNDTLSGWHVHNNKEFSACTMSVIFILFLKICYTYYCFVCTLILLQDHIVLVFLVQ